MLLLLTDHASGAVSWVQEGHSASNKSHFSNPKIYFFGRAMGTQPTVEFLFLCPVFQRLLWKMSWKLNTAVMS